MDEIEEKAVLGGGQISHKMCVWAQNGMRGVLGMMSGTDPGGSGVYRRSTAMRNGNGRCERDG